MTTPPDHTRSFPVRRVAVLGAGVMGAQIAAHLVNAGVPAMLFDLPAKEGPKNAIAQRAIEGLKKLNPAPLGRPELAAAIMPANYDEHLDLLAGCDLVIEAIAERMDWKHDLYRKVASHVPPQAIFASNTSGLSISKLSEGLPADLKRRFCGVHFFNPPRYMHLVELIPTADTDPAVLDRLETFLTSTLGKGVVRAKDTPNFIGNRIGIFSILSTFKEVENFGLAFDVVDDLTGDKLGRAKSGTFRTADVVGLDTMAHVIRTMADNIDDPFEAVYRTPAVLKAPDRQGRARPEDGRRVLPQGRQGHPAARPGKAGHTCFVRCQGRRDRRPHPQEEDLGRAHEAAARVEEPAGAVRLGDPAQYLPLRGADSRGDRRHRTRRRLRDALGFRPEAGSVRDLAAGRLDAGGRWIQSRHRRRQGLGQRAVAGVGRSRDRWPTAAASTSRKAPGRQPREPSLPRSTCPSTAASWRGRRWSARQVSPHGARRHRVRG